MFGTLALGIAASVAGSVGSGLLARSGANRQAQAAEEATRSANATQLQMFNQNRQDLMPWTQAGSAAVQRLAYLLGLGDPNAGAAGGQPQPIAFRPGAGENLQRLRDLQGDGPLFRELQGAEFDGGDTGDTTVTGVPTGVASTGTVPGGDFGSLMRDFTSADFQTDPGYDFRLAEGARALERSAAARGTAQSGGTLKALTRYNQDFASNEFGNAYNRFQSNRATRYNQLAGLAGLGQTSASQVANLGSNTANNIANNTISGMTAAAAARASGYGALGNIFQNIGNSPLNYMLLQQLGRT